MQSGAETQEWVMNIARQAAFARGYSPLYAAILDCLAGWLAEQDAAAAGVATLQRRFWGFVTARAWDNDLEPILKLAATLHSHVLRGDPRALGLRPYYATVTPDAASPASPAEPAFADALLTALNALGDELIAQADGWVVQTNETARGVVWLLPAALLQIEAAYLVELGASAGLNLLADLRRFDLRWPDGETWRLGQAEAPQFEIECEGPRPPATESVLRSPEIVARVGADARLVDLDAPDAEAELTACIWGDQPRRLQRLQEALELRRRLRGTPQALRLTRARFPDETEEFLRAAVPAHPVAPVVLFDTYVTAYFNDVDQRALVRAVEAFARPWSRRHKLAWLWVRFEPPRSGEAEAPQIGWCRWWVEVWTQGQRHTVELGWGHPHCVKLVFGPGLAELAGLRGPE